MTIITTRKNAATRKRSDAHVPSPSHLHVTPNPKSTAKKNADQSHQKSTGQKSTGMDTEKLALVEISMINIGGDEGFVLGLVVLFQRESSANYCILEVKYRSC